MQRLARYSLIALFALCSAFGGARAVAAQTPINVAGFKSPTATPTPFFVDDTFTDTDGTDLASHTGEIGTPWTKHPSFTDSITIQTNRAQKDANVNSSMYYATATAASGNYTIQVTIVDVGNANRAAGGCGWVDTSADNALCVRRQNSTTWQFAKIVGGTATSVTMTTGSATAAATFTVGASHTLTVVRTAGDNFEWFLDGVSQGTATISDSQFQIIGHVAVRASNNQSGTGYGIDRISAW